MERRETAVVAQRGLPAGAASRAFSLDELALALAEPRAQSLVYVYTDAGGRLTAGGAGGAARAAVCARLAPHPPAASAALLLAAPAPAARRLRLATTRALAPHDELLLWPEPALLALCAVPFLAPHNITDNAEYQCHVCGARYAQPNPLKLHLVLACGAPTAAGFWRALLARLGRAPPPAPAPAAPAPPRLETATPLSPDFPIYSTSACSPRTLEVLATACGSRAGAPGGHACLYCGKLYSRRYGLKIHIRTHTGYKPLRCAYCARRFGDPSNLNKHVRLHARSGRPPAHACPRCAAPHARRRDLERHVRAHHAPARALPAG